MPTYDEIKRKLRGLPDRPIHRPNIRQQAVFPVIETLVRCPSCGEPVNLGVQLTNVSFNILEKRKSGFKGVRGKYWLDGRS